LLINFCLYHRYKYPFILGAICRLEATLVG
jgi:hypothetical protein